MSLFHLLARRYTRLQAAADGVPLAPTPRAADQPQHPLEQQLEQGAAAQLQQQQAGGDGGQHGAGGEGRASSVATSSPQFGEWLIGHWLPAHIECAPESPIVTQIYLAAPHAVAGLAPQLLDHQPSPEPTPAPLDLGGAGGGAGAEEGAGGAAGGLELQLYADFLRIVLEIVNSILTNALPQVPRGPWRLELLSFGFQWLRRFGYCGCFWL